MWPLSFRLGADKPESTCSMKLPATFVVTNRNRPSLDTSVSETRPINSTALGPWTAISTYSSDTSVTSHSPFACATGSIPWAIASCGLLSSGRLVRGEVLPPTTIAPERPFPGPWALGL